MAPVTRPLVDPIGSLMLDDLRRAALFLESIADGPAPRDARHHAIRVWSAIQAAERLLVAVQAMIVYEDSRRVSEGNGNP